VSFWKLVRGAFRVVSLYLICLVPMASAAQSAPQLLPLEEQLRRGEPVVQRVAVVLGLAAYRHTPQLRNTLNDARSAAAMFRTNGFRVLEGYDLDKIGVERLLRDAVMAGGARSEIVLYFAGHGIQITGKSYLLPIDARLNDPYDVPFQTISLDSILETLRGQSNTQVAILDSCRNNPFEGVGAIANLRGVGAPIQRGFSPVRPPANTLLAFSTAPGTLAQDGTGSNSPYTSALVAAAGISPESQFDEVLKAVELLVAQSTGGQQRPTFGSALTRPFTLRPPAFFARAPEAYAASTIPSTPGIVTAPTASVMPLVGGQPSISTQPSGFSPQASGDIIAPRERLIAIGERLTQVLNLGNAQVILGRAPFGTSYAMASGDGSVVVAPTGPISASMMRSVVLRLDKVAAKNVSPTTGIVTQELTFERLDPGGFRTPRALSLSIVPDACDVEAGDWFDPQGVGLHRLDKAIRPNSAIAACTASLRADPSNARFRYQLARGYLAAGQNALAEKLAREAAEGGHIRAWLIYGKILKLRGDLNGAASAFQRGQSLGDPRATAAFGGLQLENARSDAEREAAYELLTEGVDLGLWEAMEAQSKYFETTGANPQRASRYFAEAQRRRADVAPATVPDPQILPGRTPVRPGGNQEDRNQDHGKGGTPGLQ